MPITETQRLARRHRLGSSDMPAVLAVDPWKTAYDVWATKVFKVDDIKPSEAIEIGNDFEAPLVGWAARELGLKAAEVEQSVFVDSPEGGIFAVNLDALVAGRRWGVECKTTSLAGDYGEEDTDQVPDRVIVQTNTQMMVKDLVMVIVPVLTAQFDRLVRKIYRVPRNDRLIAHIQRSGTDFWRSHVLTKTPPTGILPSIETLKRVRRIPSPPFAQVNPLLVMEFERLRQERLDAEKAEDRAKVELLAAAGELEGIDYGDAEHVYTYMEQRQQRIDTKALRAAHPQIATEFTVPNIFRKLNRTKRPHALPPPAQEN